MTSHFPEVTLNIVTLLPGERKVDAPIHKEAHFKPLKYEQLKRAIIMLREELAPHLMSSN